MAATNLYGKKKPDDWSDRFSIIVSKDYSHIPRSVTFKTNYNDVDFGTITLAVSTKYEYKSFCDFFAVNGFRKLFEQLNETTRYAYVCFEYLNQ